MLVVRLRHENAQVRMDEVQRIVVLQIRHVQHQNQHQNQLRLQLLNQSLLLPVVSAEYIHTVALRQYVEMVRVPVDHVRASQSQDHYRNQYLEHQYVVI